MPRFAWGLAFTLLFVLPLVSCIDDVPECPTCPATNGGTIEVRVDQNGLVDSAYVRVDGGSRVTLRRNQAHTFTNLNRGTHTVETTRWFSSEGVPSSRNQTFQIVLDRGERRTVVFHNDFPLITWARPTPGSGEPGWRRFHVLRAG